jgi:hypothetical protein
VYVWKSEEEIKKSGKHTTARKRRLGPKVRGEREMMMMMKDEKKWQKEIWVRKKRFLK